MAGIHAMSFTVLTVGVSVITLREGREGGGDGGMDGWREGGREGFSLCINPSLPLYMSFAITFSSSFYPPLLHPRQSPPHPLHSPFITRPLCTSVAVTFSRSLPSSRPRGGYRWCVGGRGWEGRGGKGYFARVHAVFVTILTVCVSVYTWGRKRG